jgi:hypothetical protein
MALDMQQSWLRGQIGPHVDRIQAAKNPMAELAMTSYEAVLKKIQAITNTNFGSGYLALVGGVQINMPKGHPDYFLPLHFSMQRGDSAPEDLLQSYKTLTTANLNTFNTELYLDFPGALPGPVLHERLTQNLKQYGFEPDNTILGTSICSDEINSVKGTLVDTMKEYWGENFLLGGIGGAPYVGKTGFGAFSHHVPKNGNVLVLFGPHVGITVDGEVGKCLRDGQSAASTACGACIAAYQQALKGYTGTDMSFDMQQSWLRGQIAPHVDDIKAAKNPMAALAKTSYEAVFKKMMAIANTNFGSGYLALVGGVQINMPKGYPDYFMPLHFTIQRGNSKPEDLLDSLRSGA